ncbi:hypothetical protein CCR75_009733 [Bremia lactucae]|uniref:Uncharacterized protein n=1 Tax=Bremia lactucae TaxID=4779 RepID=A0A976FS10_BRELC|nr:hypothetical protein CCR75_009733 [Bremia lactucae]
MQRQLLLESDRETPAAGKPAKPSKLKNTERHDIGPQCRTLPKDLLRMARTCCCASRHQRSCQSGKPVGEISLQESQPHPVDYHANVSSQCDTVAEIGTQMGNR